MKLPESQIQYVDLSDVRETFVDSFHSVMFDGQTGRIELCATRMNPPAQGGSATAKRYPVCRLAMTPEVFLNLANQLQQLLNVLEKNGVVKKIQQNISEYQH